MDFQEQKKIQERMRKIRSISNTIGIIIIGVIVILFFYGNLKEAVMLGIFLILVYVSIYASTIEWQKNPELLEKMKQRQIESQRPDYVKKRMVAIVVIMPIFASILYFRGLIFEAAAVVVGFIIALVVAIIQFKKNGSKPL